MNDPFSRIANKWRDYCRTLPGYRPHTKEEMSGIVVRWKEKARKALRESRLRPARRKKRRDSGDREDDWGT